jgi:hypothetical protein
MSIAIAEFLAWFKSGLQNSDLLLSAGALAKACSKGFGKFVQFASVT